MRQFRSCPCRLHLSLNLNQNPTPSRPPPLVQNLTAHPINRSVFVVEQLHHLFQLMSGVTCLSPWVSRRFRSHPCPPQSHMHLSKRSLGRWLTNTPEDDQLRETPVIGTGLARVQTRAITRSVGATVGLHRIRTKLISAPTLICLGGSLFPPCLSLSPLRLVRLPNVFHLFLDLPLRRLPISSAPRRQPD